MVTPKMEIKNNNGSADLASLIKRADAYYDHARKAGTLVVLHPVTGEHMPSTQYDDEISARHKLNVPATEFWSTPLEAAAEIGQIAVRAEIVVPSQVGREAA